jgi:hypothetical protein
MSIHKDLIEVIDNNIQEIIDTDTVAIVCISPEFRSVNWFEGKGKKELLDLLEMIQYKLKGE